MVQNPAVAIGRRDRPRCFRGAKWRETHVRDQARLSGRSRQAAGAQPISKKGQSDDVGATSWDGDPGDFVRSGKSLAL